MQSRTLCLVSARYFHTTCQQDAYESLLKILHILHDHTKIDLFPGLAFSQEAMKYSSIIRNTFYSIIHSTHTCTACKLVTTTSSNFCELEIELESDIGTGISMSKHYNFTKLCYLCNSNKSRSNQNVIIQQPLVTTICVNGFHRSMTGRLSKNTAHVLCNRSISLTYFDCQLMGLILHKWSSTNSGHYISMVKVGDICFECGDVKITKIEFNHFCNSNTVYMLFYKRSTRWKHLRGIGLVPMDAIC